MNRLTRAITAASLLCVGLLAVAMGGCEQTEEAASAFQSVQSEKGPNAAGSHAAQHPPKTAPSLRTLAKTFDDLKFDIEPDAAFERSMLTEPIEALNGQRIEIRGFILPSFRDKLRDFVLVRDDQECCFGPGAALYDCILVDMSPGKVADFSTRPVTVDGVFRIEPFDIGGTTRAVFRMTADEVE